jgi:hypothetical protein
MNPLVRTARITGLYYLGLAIAGGLGFLLIRSRLFVADDPGATLANLIGNESLARAGIALELLTVLTQALAAVWFYRLFRSTNAVAAGSIAAFGLMNAGAILGSAALIATALEVALHPVGDAAASVQILYLTSENLWGVGNLFFGLWLIPMGWAVLTSRWMPRPLGWILIGGGAGYVLSGFVTYLVPDSDAVATALVMPATVGEFWMIGYLLIRGVSPTARRETPRESADGAHAVHSVA